MSNTASAYRHPSRLRTARAKRPHRRAYLAAARRNAEMVAAIDTELLALGDDAAELPAPERPPKVVWGYGCGPGQQRAEARRKAEATADLFDQGEPVW